MKTSDVSGASTNAKVTLTMYGEKGKDTGPLSLEGGGRTCFQRGQEDQFEVCPVFDVCLECHCALW